MIFGASPNLYVDKQIWMWWYFSKYVFLPMYVFLRLSSETHTHTQKWINTPKAMHNIFSGKCKVHLTCLCYAYTLSGTRGLHTLIKNRMVQVFRQNPVFFLAALVPFFSVDFVYVKIVGHDHRVPPSFICSKISVSKIMLCT